MGPEASPFQLDLASLSGTFIESNNCNAGWGTWIRTKIDGVRVRCSTVELSPTAPATRRLRGAPCGFDARLSGRAAVVKAAPGSVSAPALLRFVALTIRTPHFRGRLGQGRRVARRK